MLFQGPPDDEGKPFSITLFEVFHDILSDHLFPIELKIALDLRSLMLLNTLPPPVRSLYCPS